MGGSNAPSLALPLKSDVEKLIGSIHSKQTRGIKLNKKEEAYVKSLALPEFSENIQRIYDKVNAEVEKKRKVK